MQPTELRMAYLCLQIFTGYSMRVPVWGMRPKATVVVEDGSHWLAKFSSRTDRGFCYPAVEHATLRLAHSAGLHVPETRFEDIGEGTLRC
jgi:hypothetical protein